MKFIYISILIFRTPWRRVWVSALSGNQEKLNDLFQWNNGSTQKSDWILNFNPWNVPWNVWSAKLFWEGGKGTDSGGGHRSFNERDDQLRLSECQHSLKILGNTFILPKHFFQLHFHLKKGDAFKRQQHHQTTQETALKVLCCSGLVRRPCREFASCELLE